MHPSRSIQLAAAVAASTCFAGLLLGPVPPAAAQQGNQQWFVPGQGGGGRPAARPPATPPARQAGQPPLATPEQADRDAELPPVQVQLPPMPEIPNVERGTAPPTALVGVFGFRDVLRASTAVQQLERTLGERRDKLNQDVQKEQEAWRELQQKLGSQRSTMSPEQIRTKERELQERVTKAQREFRDRSRILQEAYQYGAAQVERVTGEILRRVAESRGMNLVLPREQVPLSIAEFDITDAVVEQLNKIMTSVVIPPEGVPLAKFAPAAAKPDSAPTAAAPAAPAPAKPPAPPAKK